MLPYTQNPGIQRGVLLESEYSERYINYEADNSDLRLAGKLSAAAARK